MFSKAKRFDDKPVGCGAGIIYNPKDAKKTIGGVIPKAKITNSASSDTESVCSDKSIPVFRTPIHVRHVKATPKKHENDHQENSQNDSEKRKRDIEASRHEIEKEFNDKLQSILDASEKEISTYKSEIDRLKSVIDSDESKIKEFTEKIDNLSTDSEDQKREYEERINQLRDEIDRIGEEKLKFSLTLKATHRSVEVLSARLRNSDEDVAKFKNKLEEALALNETYESEIFNLKSDLMNLKKEYDKILISIVESKSALDKNHEEILKENFRLAESLIDMENDMKNGIELLKNDLFSDVERFKEDSRTLIVKFEKEADNERRNFAEVKAQCDAAFAKIAECKHLLIFAENQIELKDQELNEVTTENIKLSGTMTAVEQEKRELEALLGEFVNLTKEKDRKIHDNLKEIEKCNEDIFALEERVKKLTNFLEATEFIVREKDKDILKLQDDVSSLSSEIDSLNIINEDKNMQFEETLKGLKSENCDYKEKCRKLSEELLVAKNKILEQEALVEQFQKSIKSKDRKIEELNSKVTDAEIHSATCNSDIMKRHCRTLEIELQEMTDKYTDLLGHHNTKQKIKHVADLKAQNKALKEENEHLKNKIENHLIATVNCKKEVMEIFNEMKADFGTPTKKILEVPSFGKENVLSSHSPRRLKSPKKTSERQLTPLKESNR